MKKLLYLILLISIYSCEKDYYTVVKGKVTNSETGNPIQGYILEIREMESELFAWSYHFETLITNGNGDFEFAFEAEENILYSIRSTDNVEYTEIIQTYLEVGEIIMNSILKLKLTHPKRMKSKKN